MDDRCNERNGESTDMRIDKGMTELKSRNLPPTTTISFAFLLKVTVPYSMFD
jgi:hypothetical protein